MNSYFLPKAFDINVNSNYCSDYQYGANTTEPHWHSGAEIIFVVKGEVNVMFNNSRHCLKGGSMLFVPPKQLHCCSCTDEGAEKIVVGFTEKCLGKEGIGLSLPAEVVNYCIIESLESTQIPSLIKSFNEHCMNEGIYSSVLYAKAILLNIYAFLIEYWSGLGINLNRKMKSKGSYEIYEYIEKHFLEDLSPYTVARELNISYSCLAKSIKEFNGLSFTECVNQIRVENAKRLLALTKKSVTEIGLECGFSVTSYFIKIFRRVTSMTPKAYRHLVGNN